MARRERLSICGFSFCAGGGRGRKGSSRDATRAKVELPHVLSYPSSHRRFLLLCWGLCVRSGEFGGENPRGWRRKSVRTRPGRARVGWSPPSFSCAPSHRCLSTISLSSVTYLLSSAADRLSSMEEIPLAFAAPSLELSSPLACPPALTMSSRLSSLALARLLNLTSPTHHQHPPYHRRTLVKSPTRQDREAVAETSMGGGGDGLLSSALLLASRPEKEQESQGGAQEDLSAIQVSFFDSSGLSRVVQESSVPRPSHRSSPPSFLPPPPLSLLPRPAFAHRRSATTTATHVPTTTLVPQPVCSCGPSSLAAPRRTSSADPPPSVLRPVSPGVSSRLSGQYRARVRGAERGDDCTGLAA